MIILEPPQQTKHPKIMSNKSPKKVNRTTTKQLYRLWPKSKTKKNIKQNQRQATVRHIIFLFSFHQGITMQRQSCLELTEASWASGLHWKNSGSKRPMGLPNTLKKHRKTWCLLPKNSFLMTENRFFFFPISFGTKGVRKGCFLEGLYDPPLRI